MNFWSPETCPVPTQQGDRLDALALGAAQEPLEVGVGVVLGLLLAEEGGESLVELDQLLGRGAHVVRCHGSSLLTKCWNDESADSCEMGSMSTSLFRLRTILLLL